eukprot:153654-Rhodomonas_salina.1
MGMGRSTEAETRRDAEMHRPSRPTDASPGSLTRQTGSRAPGRAPQRGLTFLAQTPQRLWIFAQRLWVFQVEMQGRGYLRCAIWRRRGGGRRR